MDLPILLSVRVKLPPFLHSQSFNGFFSCALSENANIHIKVFPQIETRDGKEYLNITKVKAKFTTTKYVFLSSYNYSNSYTVGNQMLINNNLYWQ